MSDKTLSNAELELTQKMQMHFPRGVITVDVLKQWNGCSANLITERLVKMFSVGPEADIIVKPELLLELVGTVDVPATTNTIVVKDHIVNIRKKRKVYTWDDFEKWFLGKKIEPISKSELHYHKLRKGSVDGPIIAELGGKEKAETTLAEMFTLMEMQANGEEGVLLTNGYANIFYIRDIKGVLRAVCCDWGGGGWRLGANSVEHPLEWNAGCQVFSRNSSEAQS